MFTKIKQFFVILLLLCLSMTSIAGIDDNSSPECAKGSEQQAGLCYPMCKSDYTGVGPVCWQNCQANMTDSGAFCTNLDIKAKNTYGRGAGFSLQCRPGTEQNGALCYPKCQSGYYGVGPVCWEKTPSGWNDVGLWFDRWVKSGKVWRLETRGKGSYGRGWGEVLSSCPAGSEKNGALCYPLCQSGYSGAGPGCWQNCPGGYTNDGAFCRRDNGFAKNSYGRGVGTIPPGNDGYCQYETPLKLANGEDRAYNKTAWLTTHNAFANAQDGYVHAQQTFNVERQLKGSVRGLMLDIFAKDNEIWMCHASCDANGNGLTTPFITGKTKLVDTLKTIKSFLDTNKEAIVTIIFESYNLTPTPTNQYIEPVVLKRAFLDAGLMTFASSATKDDETFKTATPITTMLYDKEKSALAKNSAGWPLLKDMIAANTRLVVIVDHAESVFSPGSSHQHSIAVTNSYDSYYDPVVKKGGQSLDTPDMLFVFSHFLPISDLFTSMIGNAYSKLKPRAVDQAYQAAKKYPNFVAVDNYQVPFCEAFETIRDVNNRF